MSIQNILNTCFAICITLLIYQNTQLKDDIRYLKINSLSDYEVMVIAEDEARRVAENCTVNGYVNEGGWATNLSILC